MMITEVQMKMLNNSENRLKAVANILLDDEFAVHEIKVIDDREGGAFLAMPSRKLPGKNQEASQECPKFRDICHPLHENIRAAFEEVLLGTYDRALELGCGWLVVRLRDGVDARFDDILFDDFEVISIDGEEAGRKAAA